MLATAIKANESLKVFKLTKAKISQEGVEVLLKGFLSHLKLELLDLPDNQITDSSVGIISRIIDCQAERRDQVVWMHGLRNEKPNNLDYTKGLAFISLDRNLISSRGAEMLANSLKNESYIRNLNLNSNKIDEKGCKAFIHALRKNNTLINLDLQSNEGYTENVKKRLTLKLIKNIKHLRQSGYNKEEIAFYSQFVNYDLFDVEIPEKSAKITSC